MVLRIFCLFHRLQLGPLAFPCSVTTDRTDVAGAVCIPVDEAGLVVRRVVVDPKGACAVTAAPKPCGWVRQWCTGSTMVYIARTPGKAFNNNSRAVVVVVVVVVVLGLYY